MTAFKGNPGARRPACLKTIDGATGMDHEMIPKPNDLSVCLYCGNLNVFLTDLTLRRGTAEEFAGLPKEVQAQIRKAQAIGLLLAPKR